MPMGHWKNFNACLADMKSRENYSDESAHNVCGKLKANLEKGFDTHRYSGVGARHYGTMREVQNTENWHPGRTERQRHRESAQTPERKMSAMEGLRNLGKGEKSTQELPRAEKKKDEWKIKDDVPIPQYEQSDKCSDSKTTAPVQKIKKLEKGPQIRDQPHPRHTLEPTGEKSKRSQRVYDGQGMPKDIRRLGKGLGGFYNFLLKGEKWQNFVSESDKKKIPEKILTDQDSKGKQISKNECPCAGAKVEMEHKDTLLSLGIPEEKIPEAAKKIAADHVREDPDYYKKLASIEKADDVKIDEDETTESEIRQLRLKSKLSPSIKDLKEVSEVKVKEVQKDDIKKEWVLDLEALMKSDREFSGTFHKPVIDKENDIIPAEAMDKAMDDFMVLPTLQEVHTERPVGMITKAWKTGDNEYYLEGKIKPGSDCDDVWQKIKKGEYDGLSIGGRRVKYSKECAIPSLIRDTPCVTHRLKLYNVSVCSSPVNPEASIDEFNKVAKGVGEVFDLEQNIRKAMTAGDTPNTGSMFQHGIFDGRKDVTEKEEDEEKKKSEKDEDEEVEKGRRTAAQEHGARMRASGREYRGGYTRDEIREGQHKNVGSEDVDKGAWTSKRGISAGLQVAKPRPSDARPRTAQKPNAIGRTLRVNRSFGKSDILQLTDSITELTKAFTRPGRMMSEKDRKGGSVAENDKLRHDIRMSVNRVYAHRNVNKGETMEEENIEKGYDDAEVITKSDIDELTKAIQGLQKSFESYFDSLTTPQPQKIEGKKHEVEDTMKKAEPEPVKKAEPEVPVNNMEVISKAYDTKIKALEDKIAAMETQVIRKGGDVVVIPELLKKDDPILTNTAIFDKLGKVAK